MDITKKGWKCDRCGKEFLEGCYSYENRYSIKLQTSSIFSKYDERVLTDVCKDCIDDILEVIDKEKSN